MGRILCPEKNEQRHTSLGHTKQQKKKKEVLTHQYMLKKAIEDPKEHTYDMFVTKTKTYNTKNLLNIHDKEEKTTRNL